MRRAAGWNWNLWRVGLGIGAAALAAAPAAPAGAQEASIPRFPFGTPVVVVPVQSVGAPALAVWSAGGGPDGAAGGEEEALRTMDAELAFALQGRRGATDWALPEDVARRAGRNPTLHLDPRRLAYQGLLVEPDRREQLYEPLHGELRTLAALFDTRYVVLPLRLGVERDTVAVPGAEGAPRYRALLLLALIDIRRSAVLWYGEVKGDPGPAGSPGLLATLAERVANQVAPS